MPLLHYTVRDYGSARPWAVVGEPQHLAVELSDEETFAGWTAREWPAPRYGAESSLSQCVLADVVVEEPIRLARAAAAWSSAKAKSWDMRTASPRPNRAIVRTPR